MDMMRIDLLSPYGVELSVISILRCPFDSPNQKKSTEYKMWFLSHISHLEFIDMARVDGVRAL